MTIWGTFDESIFLIVPVGNPAREDGAHAVRLGLKGIGIESGTVVFDIEMMELFKVVVHAGAAKAHRPPFLQIAVDLDGLLPEEYLRVELEVMGESDREIIFIPFGREYVQLVEKLRKWSESVPEEELP